MSRLFATLSPNHEPYLKFVPVASVPVSLTSATFLQSIPILLEHLILLFHMVCLIYTFKRTVSLRKEEKFQINNFTLKKKKKNLEKREQTKPRVSGRKIIIKIKTERN